MNGRGSEVDPDAWPALRARALPGILLAMLLVLCLLVVRPFLAPMLWAIVLAYLTWPLYRRLCLLLPRAPGLSALAMTGLVSALAVLPLAWLLLLVQHELVDTYRETYAFLTNGRRLPAVLRELPLVGGWLQELLDRYAADPQSLGREVTQWLRNWSGEITSLLGGVARNVGKTGIALLTLFFFYRDGPELARQLRRIVGRLFGDRLDEPLRTAGLMTRAVVFGALVTSIVQGLLAGIGYLLFGIRAPVLMGVLTGLLSAVPMIGTAVVWIPACIGLFVAGHVWQAILLFAWGFLVVHPADNILRPLLISNAARVPFLLVMFGALGGLAAFGLIGVFIGPVVLGIAAGIWKDWAGA